MDKKWTIRELTPDEYPNTQLRYEVRDETGESVSLHYWEEDAQQMAAVPRLLKALESLERTAGLPAASDDPARVEARAAIAAAKGE